MDILVPFDPLGGWDDFSYVADMVVVAARCVLIATVM